MPILIYENKKNMIAAIHAGWKGAYKGIIDRVIKFMVKKGCKLKNFTAVIGPSISVKNYEVKEDFKKKTNCYPGYWIPPKEGTMLLFPASVVHRVHVCQSDEDRISAAFNLAL